MDREELIMDRNVLDRDPEKVEEDYQIIREFLELEDVQNYLIIREFLESEDVQKVIKVLQYEEVQDLTEISLRRIIDYLNENPEVAKKILVTLGVDEKAVEIVLEFVESIKNVAAEQ